MINIFYIILILIGLSIIIAIIDYLWFGKKLLGKTPISSKEIIFFYFTRTIGEFIILILGLIIGYNLIQK